MDMGLSRFPFKQAPILVLHSDQSSKRNEGIDSLAMDMKEKKLTVIGDVDPVEIVNKLRKQWHTDIVSIGPSKEPDKKKEEPKKGDEKKKDGKDQIAELVKAYNAYNPYQPSPYYYVQGAEENPATCVLC